MPLHARHYVIVVADTTPLLYLSRIGRLNIVQALYACLLVPREVHKELVERRPATPGVERGGFRASPELRAWALTKAGEQS